MEGRDRNAVGKVETQQKAEKGVVVAHPIVSDERHCFRTRKPCLSLRALQQTQRKAEEGLPPVVWTLTEPAAMPWAAMSWASIPCWSKSCAAPTPRAQYNAVAPRCLWLLKCRRAGSQTGAMARHQRDGATLSDPPTCHLFGCAPGTTGQTNHGDSRSCRSNSWNHNILIRRSSRTSRA